MSARNQEIECTYVSINYTMLGDFSSSDNPDFFLSIPSSLTSLDPAWTTCTPALYGAWDPPRTLPTATVLTGPAQRIAPSPPATTTSRSTPVHAPAATTGAVDRTANTTPSAASARLTPQTSNLPKPSTAELKDPTINQDSYSTAGFGNPSNTFPSLSSSKDEKPDLSNPSKASSVSGSSLIDTESLEHAPSGSAERGAASYRSGSVAQISGHDLSIESSAVTTSGSAMILPPMLAPTPSLPLINSKPTTMTPGGGLVFASSTIALGSQVTISANTISLGDSDAVIDGSKNALPTRAPENTQLSPVTLATGIVASPDSDSKKLKIGNQTISVHEPAIAISGTTVSLGSSGLYIGSSLLPLTTAIKNSSAGPGDPVISAFQSGPRPDGNRSNGSNAVVFTDGISRFPNCYSISDLTLMVAIIATIALVL